MLLAEPVAADLPLSTEGAAPEVEKTYQVPTPDSTDQSHTPDTGPVAEAVTASVNLHVGFDPAIHAVNPDGTPRLRVNGTYALKRGKGGRKSQPDATTSGTDDLFGTAENVAGETTTPDTAPTTANAPTGITQTPLNSREAAAMIVMTCTSVLAKVVGPEWQADKDEAKNLTNATKVYLDSKGGLNVSPEMALFLAVTGYAVPRMAHENTQSKFGRAVQWCKDRINVLRARVGM